MQYMVPLLNMQAPAQSSKQQQLLRTVSISILVMSLPVLYVSFLHVPPAALFRDTTFWFLMSNSIIIVIAADSGMLFFGSSSSSRSVHADVDDGLSFVDVSASTGISASDEVETIIKNQSLLVVREQGDLHAYALVVRDGQAQQVGSKPERREMALRRRHSHRPSSHSHALVPVQDKSVVVREERRQLRRAAAEEKEKEEEEEKEKESDYSRLSDEELNRRVEEFITRFNREIRLQLEKEQATLTHASTVHA